MVVGQIYSPLIQLIFKILRLPYLIKFYLWRENYDAVGAKAPAKNVKLVDGSVGYQIIDKNSHPISITWPERFSRPVDKFSDLDGYWPVDVSRFKREQTLYHVYWLRPFDCNLHVWIVNERGERVGCYDANAIDKYRFFLNRIQKSNFCVVRLYMLSTTWVDNKTCAEIKPKLLAAAESGFLEAIYCILSAPKLFSSEELRACVEQAVNNIYNICSSAAPSQERKSQTVTVEKLAQALESHNSNYDFFSSADIQEKINYFEAFGNILDSSLSHRKKKFSVCVHEKFSDDKCMSSNFNIQSIAIVGGPEFSTIKFNFLNSTDATRVRVMSSAGYAKYLLSILEQAETSKHKNHIFDRSWILDLEAGDLPGRSQCVAFERAVGDLSVGLIPDLYYFSSRGFRSGWIDGVVPPWTSKRTMFTWRGITSGGHNYTVDSISTLPRFRMCSIGRELGPLANVGISQIVQARSKEDAIEIERYLKSIDLWREYIPQHVMGNSKFLLEIDGYANSWGFLAKLLMGCCVLKVDSPYEQWFYGDLKPWVHYIPIAQDLSNLLETMEWCLLNEPACRDIAREGMAFAEERTFDREMKAAAATMASFARPLA
jgi:hypothetical protein